MAEAVLRANSLRLRFERGKPEPTDTEIFAFMKGKMGLKSDNLLSMYKDKPEQSVIIKFQTEDGFKEALSRLPGTMEFAYNKYKAQLFRYQQQMPWCVMCASSISRRRWMTVKFGRHFRNTGKSKG